jgi:hypothetical protein
LRRRRLLREDTAKILSVPERTIRDWLSRIDKDTKVERNKRIFDAWLACYTQEEIAEKEGIPRTTVEEALKGCDEIGNLAESVKIAATYMGEDWFPFNVWKQQEKTPGSSHFGNSEVTILDRLLWNPDYSAGKQRKVCSVGQPHDMVKEIDRYRG